ncbi:MAG TPA: response regulator transcription factor [Dongiaceae bacterium]|nr:response regulator transcription factor [Dongiaceae bacterium]
MYSILIIEDDPAYCSMMELILQMEGFDVHTASDGQSGLALLRAKRPDLILCDIMMPEMDGHSVLEILKGDDRLVDIPFIFVTALVEREDVRGGMSAGADDYLPKPFSADELLAAVTGRIRRHEMIKLQQAKSAFHEEKTFLSHTITKREREVLLLVGHGATTKEIAERLGIAPKTVEVHRANLMRKLDATNAAGLARWAFIFCQSIKAPPK